MAIRTVITRGFGNGTFNGTIALVVTMGYAILVAVIPAIQLVSMTLDGKVAEALTLDGEAATSMTLDGKTAESLTLDATP